MSIRIKEAVLIHESVIFRFLEDGASGSPRSLNHIVNFGSAGATEAIENLKKLGSVTYGSRRKCGKQGLR
jgi:hypothetical protein